jgi:endonuclease/exonuclease/phosphatase family metal-dependent hydrolase
VTLRIASYNIRFGGIGRAEAIGAALAELRADVVILQEATHRPTVEAIAERLELATVIAEPGRSVAVLSRIPIGTTSWHPLGFGHSAIELGLADLRIFGVHLSAGLSRRGERRRQVQVAHLLGLIATSGSSARTAIVGDFNAITPGDAPTIALLPRWIRILLRFDGGIRTEVMAALIEAGYCDAYRRLHPDLPGFTMPSVEPSVRLDYVMLGAGLLSGLRACDAMVAGPTSALASDHLALVAELDPGAAGGVVRPAESGRAP